LVAWGQPTSLWNKSVNHPLFFDVKRAVQALLERLLVQGSQFPLWKENVPPLLHPAQAATVFVEGKSVGYVAALSPKWLGDEKVRVPVAIASVSLAALKRGQPRTVKYQPVSKFPAVERDLAFVMPKTLPAADVSKEIKKISGPLLQSVDVFDVFSGGNLAENEVSVSFKMVFQDQEGTLTEDKLQTATKQIIDGVSKKLSIKVR
jgi:phenylalanyl-tRNA synthetase beta chain